MASNWTAFSALAFPVTEIQYIKRFIILFYIFGKYQELSNQKYSGCKEIQNYLANTGRQSWLYTVCTYIRALRPQLNDCNFIIFLLIHFIKSDATESEMD